MIKGVPGFTRRTLVWTIAIAALAVAASSIGALATVVSTTPGPSAPPPRPDGFPSIAGAYLPGVDVPSLTRWWDTHGGAACMPPQSHPSELGGRWQVLCQSVDRRHRLRIVYDTDTTVRAVSLVCSHPPGSPACHTLYPSLVTTVTAADVRDQAVTWTAGNIDRDAMTRIDAVRLVTTLVPHQLQLYPAE